jgi:hypothetical protein
VSGAQRCAALAAVADADGTIEIPACDWPVKALAFAKPLGAHLVHL